MTRSGTVRLAAVLVTVIWVCLEGWAVGPVMRESDQASLLEGAVKLARGSAPIVENDSYNYDKQYLSYWIVGAWLKLRGAVDGEGSSRAVVGEGNLLAVTLFALALLATVGSQRKWSGVQVAVLYCALFSPVLAFSGLFLSPNMISAAFVLALATMLRGLSAPSADGEGSGPSAIRLGLVGLTAWAATAARQDAILLMPLLALLVSRGTSLRASIFNRVVGAMLAGCVVAIVSGFVLSENYAEIPTPFFVLPTFVAFLGGGLGALLILVLVLGGKLALSWSLRRIALAGAVLLPLVFYSCVLYTPRHLFLAAFALLLTICFDRGREAWLRVVDGRVGRIAVVVSVLGTLGLWLVGARMSGWKQGRPVTAAATLFPSTDGFWPVGAHGWFFSKLAEGAVEPIDHNQEVWTAWSTVDATQLPVGRGLVLSSGLVSYGTFHLTWAGKEQAASLEEADFVLFDERTLGKRQRGVNSTEGRNRARILELLNHGEIRVVGEAMNQRILLFVRGKRRETDPGVSVKLALYGFFGGNDFRVSPWGGERWKLDELEDHRGVVAGRSRAVVERFRNEVLRTDQIVELVSSYDEEPWWTVPTTAEEWRELAGKSGNDFSGLWIAFGSLPSFMDVRSYGK